MSHFGEGAGLGLKIRYSLEPDLLGTAGGVKAVADFLTTLSLWSTATCSPILIWGNFWPSI